MSTLLIHNTLTKLWRNFLINERENGVNLKTGKKVLCPEI